MLSGLDLEDLVRFQSVQVTRVHAEVSRQIARRIISGGIEPGQFLPTESELTRDFEVSRVPVREALRSLAQRGLIGQAQGRRTIVLGPEDWDVFDPMVLAIMREEGKIYDVLRDFTTIRMKMEPEIAASAAEIAGPDLIERLEKCLDTMRALHTDHEGYYQADLDFHAALAAATGSRVMHRLIKVIGSLFSQDRKLPPEEQSGSLISISGHQAILDAIKSRDSKLADELMREHITWAARGVYEMYSSGNRLEPLEVT